MDAATVNSWALRLHVVLGVLAVVVAPAAMVVTKGGWWHRLWGRIFVGSMLVVLTAAVPLAYYRNDVFLFYLAVVNFYMTVSGYRVHARKRRNYRGGVIDWMGALATVAASMLLIRMGQQRLNQGAREMGIVMSVFGGLLALLATTDIVQFVRPPRHSKAWWFDHMGKMLGAYLAAITAVSVVQFSWLPTVVRWLWPSAIGIPGIFAWIQYYKRRFDRAGVRAAPPLTSLPAAGGR